MELKCSHEYFEAILSGSKTFELRKNDRDFRVGDIYTLREYNGSYSGREIIIEITYVLSKFNSLISPGYCIFSFKVLSERSSNHSDMEGLA